MVMALAALAAGGCNIVGPAAYIVEGPPTVSALYKLPKDSKVVVFVDDRRNVMPRLRLRSMLGDTATQTLLNEKLVAAAVDSNAAYRVATAEDYGTPMPIDEVGRQVDAEIVIYAEPTQFVLFDRGLPRPYCTMNVRVVDSRTGAKLWPMDAPSYQLRAAMSERTESHYRARDGELIQEELATLAGLRLAQIFYEHEPNPLDGEVGP